MSNISEFRGAIKSGLVRQHKWRIVFDWPAGVGTVDAARQASLLARTASVPQSMIGVIELGWGGRILPWPGDRAYEEFTVNFIGVNDHNVRDALEQWSEAINGSESNTGLTDMDDFSRDITLQLLDASDRVTKTYVLRDAWPSIVGTSELDAGAMDTYAEFSVTFRYVTYETNVSR